jgi:HEPN domain-containing protein
MNGKRKIEAKRWFQQAYYDLQAARWNIKGGFHDTACFLAQQAGEKALKSLLYYEGARRAALLTHSLVEMVREGEKRVRTLAGLLDQARELDFHYIPSGYPHQFYGKKVAQEAVTASEKIFSSIRRFYQTREEKEILKIDDH